MFSNYFNNHRNLYSVARNSLAAVLSIFCLAGAGAGQAQQNPGSLDPTFNGNGKIIANLGNPDNIAGAVAVQSDGKIVVAGLTGTISIASQIPGTSDFAVLRYNPDGTPDNTFDGDGRVVTSFGNGEDGAGAVLIQPDGKILVAGSINTKTPAGEIALARYNPDGSLDQAFDGDGKVTTDVAEFQNVEERAEAMILQPDGKILVVVSTIRDDSLDEDVFVVRYNTDGSLDTSFAGDGITTLPFAIPGGVVQGLTGSDIALQSDGKIVVIGTVATNQGNDVFVWRLHPDGSDDQTFGGRVVTVSFNISDRGVSVFVLPDNKILVAAATFNVSFRNDFAFARLNADGRLDASFGTGGKKITSYNDKGFTIPLEFERLSNGKLVSIGPYAPDDTIPNITFAVTRFTAEGNLDPTFDGDGKAITDFGGGIDFAQGIAVQSDEKIIAAGHAETGASSDNFDIAIARYIGDAGVGQRKTEFDFDGDGKSDIAVYRPGEQSYWYFLLSGSNNAFAAVQWGIGTDRMAPADYDGDGKTDIAVWRESDQNNPDRSYFYILNSSNNSVRIEQFGKPGDTPFSGDWDGDGRADLAVYREATNPNEQSRFYYRPSSAPNTDFVTIIWGIQGDKPMHGDFDGDGKLDAAVFRPSNSIWYIRQSSNGEVRYESWGGGVDRWVPADYDGDGKTDVAVYRAGTWYIKQSSNNQPRYAHWGSHTDTAVPADYDGDGKADFAVYRDGTWYLLGNASGEMKTVVFGLPTDSPVQRAYLQFPIIF